MKNRFILSCVALASCLLPLATVHASDLVRIGAGAKAMGMANVAGLADDPLSAISANPAFLAGQEQGIQVSLQSLWVDSDFTSTLGERAGADRGPGVIPDAAFALPLANSRWTLGGGVTVQSGMLASFEFTDPPGTLGVSYGRQTHESRYSVVSTTAAAAYRISDNLSLGIQAGMAWNRNQLKAPYIFQSHPGLQGLKVLVDLDVDDTAPVFALGLDYRTINNGRLWFAWGMAKDFDATGDTTGNLGQLGLFRQETFAYDTAVHTAMPAWATAGYAWQAADTLRVGIQLDWIGWQEAFDALPIYLTNGSNDELNAFLGSTGIADTAPLAWDDQLTFHIGGELTNGTRRYRFGYDYSDVPVPASTMTPMTGAILRHGLSAGASLSFNGHVLDLAYRASFGRDTTIDAGALQGPEYAGTRLELTLHSLGIAFHF